MTYSKGGEKYRAKHKIYLYCVDEFVYVKTVYVVVL